MFTFKKSMALAAAAYLVHAGDRSDADKTAEELCVENGFQYEEHTVTTSDGYIL